MYREFCCPLATTQPWPLTLADAEGKLCFINAQAPKIALIALIAELDIICRQWYVLSPWRYGEAIEACSPRRPSPGRQCRHRCSSQRLDGASRAQALKGLEPTSQKNPPNNPNNPEHPKTESSKDLRSKRYQVPCARRSQARASINTPRSSEKRLSKMSFEIGDRVVFWAEQDGFSVRLEGTIETVSLMIDISHLRLFVPKLFLIDIRSQINESTYCIEAEIDGRYETVSQSQNRSLVFG